MSDDIFEVFEELFEWRKKRKGDKKKSDRDRGGDRTGEVATSAGRAAVPPVFCIDCGARNEGDARFCMDCGKLLPSPGEELRCPRCSSVVPLTAKFCPRCGTGLAVR